MEGVKIYGLCLERLRHQIINAKGKVKKGTSHCQDRVLLESYNTGELDDIIDILELYDVKERTFSEVKEKLEDLAYTVSELLRETIQFDYIDEGHLGLYLATAEESAVFPRQEVLAS